MGQYLLLKYHILKHIQSGIVPEIETGLYVWWLYLSCYLHWCEMCYLLCYLPDWRRMTSRRLCLTMTSHYCSLTMTALVWRHASLPWPFPWQHQTSCSQRRHLLMNYSAVNVKVKMNTLHPKLHLNICHCDTIGRLRQRSCYHCCKDHYAFWWECEKNIICLDLWWLKDTHGDYLNQTQAILWKTGVFHKVFRFFSEINITLENWSRQTGVIVIIISTENDCVL